MLDNLNDYLAVKVRGVSTRLEGAPIHSFTETLQEVCDVRLLCRVVIRNGILSFPPYIQPEEMSVNSRFLGRSLCHALVDTDGFVEGRAVFSTEHIGKQLNTIHDVVWIAFRKTVTEHAFNVWDDE